MLYSTSLTIPANTAENSKAETTLKVSAGTIVKIGILIPPGHAGLAHLQIFDGGHQILPSTEGQNIKGDDIYLPSKEEYELKPGGTILTLKGWNTDTIFQHEFIVYIWIERPQEQAKQEEQTTILTKIGDLFKGL